MTQLNFYAITAVRRFPPSCTRWPIRMPGWYARIAAENATANPRRLPSRLPGRGLSRRLINIARFFCSLSPSERSSCERVLRAATLARSGFSPPGLAALDGAERIILIQTSCFSGLREFARTYANPVTTKRAGGFPSGAPVRPSIWSNGFGVILTEGISG